MTFRRRRGKRGKPRPASPPKKQSPAPTPAPASPEPPKKEEPKKSPSDEYARRKIREIVNTKMRLWDEMVENEKDTERQRRFQELRKFADEEMALACRVLSKNRLNEYVNQKMKLFADMCGAQNEDDREDHVSRYRDVGEQELMMIQSLAEELSSRNYRAPVASSAGGPAAFECSSRGSSRGGNVKQQLREIARREKRLTEQFARMLADRPGSSSPTALRDELRGLSIMKHQILDDVSGSDTCSCDRRGKQPNVVVQLVNPPEEPRPTCAPPMYVRAAQAPPMPLRCTCPPANTIMNTSAPSTAQAILGTMTLTIRDDGTVSVQDPLQFR